MSVTPPRPGVPTLEGRLRAASPALQARPLRIVSTARAPDEHWSEMASHYATMRAEGEEPSGKCCALCAERLAACLSPAECDCAICADPSEARVPGEYREVVLAEGEVKP